MLRFATFAAMAALLFPGVAGAQAADPLIIVTVTPSGRIIDPKDNPELKSSVSIDSQAALLDALSQYENFGTDIETILEIINGLQGPAALAEETLDRSRLSIETWVKPLSGADLEGNFNGYSALAKIDPSNEGYLSKLAAYGAKLDAKRKVVLTRFKKSTDEFNGITWYHHKNIPKYTDTRSYVELYIGKKGDDPPFIRFKINYTARSWLFISTARINIDGTFIDVPQQEWQRDNDSEIWEWIDVIASSQYLEIAEKIAGAKKAIIRFDGQQYYDDYSVRSEDKEAIRDTLLAFDVLKDSEN